MTGAGRLSSDPQPVMTSSACPLPLTQRCLSTQMGLRSCERIRKRRVRVGARKGKNRQGRGPRPRPGVRQRRIASTENGTRRSVSIATPKAARGTECSDETG